MWVLVALGLAYLAYASSQSQQAPTPRPGGRTFAVAGDSIGEGMAPPFLRLARASGADGQSFAVQSTTAAEWLSRGWLAAITGAGVFTDALVSLGTNDANSKVPADVLRAQFQQVVDTLRAAGIRVYWQEPPTRDLPRGDEIRAIIRGLSGVVVVSGSGVLAPGQGNHPTTVGYSELAGRAWAAAQSL